MIRMRAVLALAAGLVLAAPVTAPGQGRGPKAYKASPDRAGVVVREVLDQHGWVFISD